MNSELVDHWLSLFTETYHTGSAAAIWSLAYIAYIAIRDMSKVSRYCIAIFFKYIHRAIIDQ